MELFSAAGLINGVVSISFGFLVAFKNLRERANQIFFLMTISLAVWSLGYWQWLTITDNYDLALFWVRVLSVGSLFIPVLFFHWVTILLGENKGVNRFIAAAGYIIGVGISLLATSPLFISGLTARSYFPLWPSPGVAYDVYFSFIYVGFVLYALYLLFRSYFLSDNPDKKGQILFVILGSILGFGGGLTNFPLWWGIPIPPYGNFLVAAFPFLLGYSVLHYRMFNAKAIATEILVFFTAIILFAQVILSNSVTEFVLRGAFAVVVSLLGILVIRSVYREVEQRQKIESLAKDLEETNERQEKLIHFIGHEVKGYLTKGEYAFSEMADGDFGALPPETKILATTALAELRKGVASVTDILQAANLKRGTVAYDMKPVDLKDLVKEEVIKTGPQADEKKLALEARMDDSQPYTVNLDRGQFGEHVIRNLIDNSIKYTPQGNIMIKLARAGDKIVFSVKDTGVGISDEDRARLFTEGGRGKDSMKVNVHSTGYGLYIAKQIVEAHSGKIWVESEGPGKGSTFFVELPVSSN